MSWTDSLRRRRKRPLRALQVEVTSRCTRRCVICPRSVLFETWREGDMDQATWDCLEPELSLAEHVHLQGWGEPLLHPALHGWARSAREAGCKVGLTTNGDLLESSADWLERDVDSITLSVAGDARVHSALRDGSQLDPILSIAGSLRSRIQLSFLLTRENAASLPTVIEMAARAGLAEVFVIHLECRPGPSFVEQSAFTGHGIREEVVTYLDEAEKTAKRLRIPYRGPGREGEDVLTCALDPLRFAFIGWDGRVAPCVNLLLPADGTIPRWSETEVQQIEPFSYGRLQDSRLSELLASETRRRFITPFKERLAAERQFVSSLNVEAGVTALRELDVADAKRISALASHPLPSTCTGCPKANGL